MAPKPKDFRKDLPFGLEAEQAFLSAYAPFIEKANLDDLRAVDFSIFGTEVLLELKADRYTSGNVFLERWSDKEAKKPGGPWKAYLDGATYLAYWLVNQGVWYFFDTEALLACLDGLDLKPYEKEVRNRGYCTFGYAIPVKLLKGCYSEHLCEFRKD